MINQIGIHKPVQVVDRQAYPEILVFQAFGSV